jgi:2-haloacid dehalogenase
MAVFVFDAYGTLFDVAAAARAHPALASHWQALAEDWRRKQLEYTWLRRIMDDHADFRTVTRDALDWALEARGLGPDLAPDLMALYDQLHAFPEVPQVLGALGAVGHRLAILSNGTPAMLDSAVRAAGLDGVFEAVLSVEEIGAYKPDARVYDLACARLGVAAGDITFASSNGWDIAGAARFGFRTCWINRARAPIDRLSHGPAHILSDLTGLLTLDAP